MSDGVEIPAVLAEGDAPPAQHAAGDLRVPAGIRVFEARPNVARRSVSIAVSRFNGEVTQRLLDGALEELGDLGVAPEAGRDPQGRSYVRHAAFSDPDGSQWILQEVTERVPGRV